MGNSRKGDARGRAHRERYVNKFGDGKKEPSKNTGDMNRWFGKFIDKVGSEDAQILLRGAGELVGSHQDVPNTYSTSLSYHNCGNLSQHQLQAIEKLKKKG